MVARLILPLGLLVEVRVDIPLLVGVVWLLLASLDAVVVATGQVIVIVPKLCGFVVVLLLCGDMQRCLVLVCCTQTCTYICCWLLFIP